MNLKQFIEEKLEEVDKVFFPLEYMLGDLWRDYVYNFKKKIKQFISQSIQQAVEDHWKEIQPDIKEHICRFNDGECICGCYKKAQDDFNYNHNKFISGE